MGSSDTHPQNSYKKRRCSCVQLCAAVRSLPRKTLVVLDDTPRILVPTCRWWLLVKLTPNMTVRPADMGRGCHGFECGTLSGVCMLSTSVLTCCMRCVGVVEYIHGVSATGSTTECRGTWRGLISSYIWSSSVWPSKRGSTLCSG